ncbi:MAG: SwmB domain-containing protein [Actinobacteria bacterium]|nr:SwmB domain-containing protein [Actinomycetota bacterium]
MFTAPLTASRVSKWRAFGVVFSLIATLLVAATSLAPRAVLADSGEAPYGTPTQALQSAISLGDSHTCVIVNSNVVCYGQNSNGQLGNGTTTLSKTPVYVKDSATNTGARLSGVISIAAAAEHTCALLSNGKVKCWGYGYRTGTGYYGVSVLYPTFVKSSFADGDLNARNGADLTGAVAITSATYGGCALLNDGKVKCWGGSAGHDGEGTGYVLACNTPNTTANCSTTGSEVPLTGVKSITQAGQTTCGILSDESMVCWGQDQGKLANTNNVATDTQLPKPAGSSTIGAKAFGTTQSAICGLYQNGTTSISSAGGTVKCWGGNGSGQLGRGVSDSLIYYTAEAISGLTNAIAISGHGSSFCALLITSSVKCWGSNPGNQFGTPAGIDYNVPTAMELSGSPITGVAAVTLGQAHICIIMAVDGQVKCSGSNVSGQLGDGTLTTRGVPTNVVQGEVTGTGGNLTGAGADNMPPALLTKVVSTTGTKIVLTYDEQMDSSAVIPTNRFALTVGGVSKTISSVTFDGTNVELNLAERIPPSVAVNLTYTDPSVGDDINVIQDASFNDAASIPSGSITNSSTTEAVAPTLVSGAVNAAGTSLTLTYSEALGTTTAPTSAFTVTYGGSSRTPTGISVSGSTVVLTLSPAVQQGQTVTVAYVAPTANLATTNTAVQDDAGNDAASFLAGAVSVTNSSTYDTVAPTFVSGAMNGPKTKMILTFNETLSATVPTAGQFRYRVNGGSSITPTTAVVVSGSTVEVTLNAAIVDGNTIEFTYTDSTAGNDTAAIQDTSGNDAATISTFTTVANVTDVTAPLAQSAAVDAAGTSLTITYNEALNSTTAVAGDFAVRVGGSPRSVTGVAVSGSTVVLTLSPAVQRSEVVTVAYVAPASNAATTNNAIQDSVGNDAVSFSATALDVTNSSTTDTTAPTFVSATVSTGGSILLTYNEALNTTTAPTSRFQVTIGGTAVTVSSVTVSGSVVTIVTTPVVGAGQSVAVTYSAPSSGNTIEDTAGNDAASSGTAWTISGGSNLSTLDLTGPTLVSTAVNAAGAAVLTFSETLGATGPSASAFSVTVDGVTLSVTSVSIVGSTVVIVTSPRIESGKAVSITYSAPSSNTATSNTAIQDAAGNDAAGATLTVTSANNASTYDPTPPTRTGSEVNDGGKLVITYSETLATPGPDASQFTVTIDGKTATIVSVEVVDNKIVITTSPLIAGGETVTWAFTDATSGNDAKGIQDAAGNDVGSGTNGSGSVTNGSKVSNVDPVPPTVSGSEVNEGGKVVISFSETLAAPGPDSSQFTVTIDGSPVTIVSVEVIDNKVIITTAPLVADGQTVTWKYVDPTSGNDQKAIQDKSGNDLGSASIGSGSVTNGSKVTKEAAEIEEDPATTMLSDEVTVDGVNGTATFGDGSQIVVSGKFLKIRFKTGYIGNAGGTVTGTYLVGKKKTKYKCTVASFGTVKKNPTAKRIYPSKKMGLWFKKKIHTPKTPCVMPTAMQTALKTQRITLTVKLNFKRLWPNTAKAVDDQGKPIPKSTRIMKLKIGKAPTK